MHVKLVSMGSVWTINFHLTSLILEVLLRITLPNMLRDFFFFSLSLVLYFRLHAFLI